jgi:hypothetical protein
MHCRWSVHITQPDNQLTRKNRPYLIAYLCTNLWYKEHRKMQMYNKSQIWYLLTRLYSLTGASAPLLPGISCSRSVSSVRPCPWLRLHWGPSPVGISTSSSLLDRHGACVTAVTSQHARAQQIIKCNTTYRFFISLFLTGM